MGFSVVDYVSSKKKTENAPEQSGAAGSGVNSGGGFSVIDYINGKSNPSGGQAQGNPTDSFVRDFSMRQPVKTSLDMLPGRGILDAGITKRQTSAQTGYTEQQGTDALRSELDELTRRESELNSRVNDYYLAGMADTDEYRKTLEERDLVSIDKIELDKYIQGQPRLQALREFEQKQTTALSGLSQDVIGLLDDYNTASDNIWAQAYGSGMYETVAPVTASGKFASAQSAAKQSLRELGYSDDEIKQLADYRKRQTDAESSAEMQHAVQEWTGESTLNKVLGSVASVPLNLAGGVSALNEVINSMNYQDNAPLNTSSQFFALSNASDAIRQTTSEDMGKVGSFLYNTGMSGLDSLAAMAVGPVAGEALLGLSAATNTMKDLTARGATAEQAITGGVAAGVFEALFEHVSIGNFRALKEVPIQTWKDAVKNVGKSMLVNFTEEGATEIANILYDTAVNGDISNYELAIQSYMDQGMSEREAKAKVSGELAGQVFEAGLSGAVMGAGFGGLGVASSRINMARSGGDVVSGEAQSAIPKMNMSDFADSQSEVWTNVDYNDTSAQSQITQSTHNDMVENGNIVALTDSNDVSQYYPDLRTTKKAERNSILKQKMTELKTQLRSFLQGLAGGSFEFEVNGNIIDAKLYSTGINEVLSKLTQDKAAMLYQSEEIFRNSQYLYSMPDYEGNPNIYRWNYFYTPVQIGEDIVGVRIAVRDVANPAESQIYNWGIKKEAPLSGDGRGVVPRIPTGASSDASTNTIPQPAGNVNTADTVAYNVRAVEDFSKTLGKAGAQVLNSMYISESQDAAGYAGAMGRYYNAGVNGAEYGGVRADGAINEYQARAAYLAGQADGASAQAVARTDGGGYTVNDQTIGQEAFSNVEAEEKAGDPRSGGVQQRADNLAAGESGGQLESRAGEAPAGRSGGDQAERAAQIRAAAEVQGLVSQSTAGQGIAVGTNSKTLKVIPASMWTDGMRTAAREQSKAGRQVIYFTGALEMTDGSGTYTARGAVSPDGKRIWVRADHETLSVEQIIKHEQFHAQAKADQGLMARLRDRILQKYGGKGADTLVDWYAAQYFTDADGAVTVDSDYILEEIFADAYAEIDVFDYMDDAEFRATDYSQDAQGEVESSQGGEPAGQVAGDGGVRYSLNEKFQSEFDAWIAADKPNRKQLLLGTTSEALQSIGVYPRRIFWDTSKINKIQRDHPGMSDSVIRQVPDIIENPVIVMDSKTQPNRITMFGEVYDENGLPVMAVLELLPTSHNNYELDAIKVANAYAKDRGSPSGGTAGTQGIINTSAILYIDPDSKRTDTWLSRNQLQLPLGITAYGPIDSIAYVHRNDNGNFSSKSDAMPLTDWQQKLQGYLDEDASDGQENAQSEKFSRELTAEGIRRIAEKMTPAQIAGLTQADANTTPILPPIDASGERGGDSKFYGSVMKSENVSDTVKPLVETVDDIKYYLNISNLDTLNAANDRLNALGERETWRWRDIPPDEATATDIAEGFILLKRYQDAGDYDTAVTVLTKLRQMGTKAGQTVQAFAILGKMTPEGMAVYAQKELDSARREMVKKYGEAWAEKRADMFRLTAEEIEFIKGNIEKASTLPDGRDKNILLAEIASTIEAKLPTSALKQTKAWARNSMLLNPKTMIRNVMGNTVMMPAYVAQDFVGAAADKLASAKSGVRTTGVTLPNKAAGKAAVKGLYESYDDFRRKINTRQSSGDRFEIGQGDSFHRYKQEQVKAASPARRAAMRLSNALNKVDRLTGFLLDAGDRPFFEYHFTNSLNNQLKLNNASEATAEMVDIATTEALQRTWQDDNGYTKAVNSIRNALNFGKEWGLGSIVVPFTKTPANLTKALVEYSPPGASIIIARKAQIYLRSVKSKNFDPRTQKAFVDSLAKGVTGTLVMAIGGALTHLDFMSGGDDDKDRDVAAFEKNILGIAPYSITIDGKSYTYDWAQPIGGMFAISADFVQNLKSGNEPMVTGLDVLGNVGNSILNALSAGGNVLFEQSFLQGVADLFANEGLMAGIIEAASGAASQFVPTALSQIAQIIDPYARTSFEYKNTLQTTANKAIAKLPGARESLAPVVDVLGNDVYSYGGNNSLFNVFFNPANIYSETATKAALEIYRVYEETGDAAVVPRNAPYYISYKDERYNFTAQERAQYQRTAGQTNAEIVESLVDKSRYLTLSDEKKAEVLTYAVNYANALAKYEYLKEQNVLYKRDSWMLEAEAGSSVKLSVADYLVAYTVTRGIESLKGSDGDTIENSKSLLIMDAVYKLPALTDAQRQYLFECFDVGKKVIGYNKAAVTEQLAKMRKQ